MGKRRHQARFAPGKYVFPGGIFEREDVAVKPVTPFQMKGLASAASRNIQGFANTAIRETFEETGLLLGEKGKLTKVNHPTWNQIRQMGMVPSPYHLTYLGRAITPASWPRRFHARFFVASAELFLGTLVDDGELVDLRWVNLAAITELPMLDVTEFMLEELRRYLRSSRKGTPLMSYRGDHTLIRYE